jgi:hypothetical protein
MLLDGVADDFTKVLIARQLRAIRVVIWLARCQGAALLTIADCRAVATSASHHTPTSARFLLPCRSPRECSAFVGPFALRCGRADPNPA